LGILDQKIDVDRCRISSIDTTEAGINIAMVVLPPATLPKITACGVKKNSD